ncbi:MAG: thioether cross-link-forming SCIFF peptide maturase [Peptococcaceae bacterium]|nr:thioether cross-link-forming SCIFF peptide maturase [Peptococcaceae bacterium]
MIHCFEVNGCKLVFDVHSLSLHRVDDLVWDILNGRAPGKGYLPGEVEEARHEIEELRRAGVLFAPDPIVTYEPPETPLKSLCLNVAHSCNLACRYCFAGSGRYGSGPALMPREVGRRAVEMLLERSGTRRRLEIDFFGGEPLLNFEVVQDIVTYARERAAAVGKEINFTLTTNGVLLDDAVGEFLLKEAVNVVLSIDGRPGVHDRMRPTPDGRGTHNLIISRARRFAERWDQWSGTKGYFYVRGTYTRHNLDFDADYRYLADFGFRHISIEPVVSEDNEYGLREEDLSAVSKAYQRLAEDYLARVRQGRRVRFFHFEVDLDGGPCLPKLLSGCGAGQAYLAVAANGTLYPCHQLVGQENFKIGDVFRGVNNSTIPRSFTAAHVYAKEHCRSCWAKYLCSGGCHAGAYLVNRDIYKPNRISCAIMRARLETALYVKAVETLLAVSKHSEEA